MNYKTFLDFVNNSTHSTNKAFLLEKISDICGFFSYNKKLCFIVKQTSNKSSSVSTNYVEFIPKIQIMSVENDPSFKKGNYDILILKEEIDKDIITSFIDLCEVYGNNPTMPFDEFINSIIDLFQLARKQSFLDGIGLLGELFVLYYFYKQKIDLSPFWHQKGSYSQYDFSLPELNIEVKSTNTDSTTFKIKHSQIFNNDPNYIALVILTKTENTGFSLEQFFNYFKFKNPFCTNLRFLIELEKEFQKKIDPDMFKNRFDIVSISFFDVKQIKTISNIPFNITNVTYNYDFDISKSKSLIDFINILKANGLF